MTGRRVAAALALASAGLTAVLAVLIVIQQFPRGLIVLGCVGIALTASSNSS